MTDKDRKSKLSYLNKLVDQYSNTYHHSISEKPINGDYSALTEKLRRILKILSFTLKIGLEKYLLSILCWKLLYLEKLSREKHSEAKRFAKYFG